MLVRLKALDTAAQTVQHGRQVQLPILAWNLGNIRKQLFVWLFGTKVLMD